MINRIVVGTDFSEQAATAASHAMAIARRSEAEVVLVHVLSMGNMSLGMPYPVVVPEAYQVSMTNLKTAAKARLEDARKALLGQGVELSHEIVEDLAQRGLVESVKELRAKLVVVGSHGRTGVSRFLLGSIAEQVTRHAPCDVLVARGNAPDGGYKRVIVPTDFSPMGDLALERAVGLAEPGGQIEVLHCWQLPGGFSMEWGESTVMLREGTEESARHCFEQRIERFANSGFEFSFKSVESPTRLGILDRVEEADFDLIVMGSHGRTGLKRVLLGSIAETTIRHSKQSVYIARESTP